MRLPIALLVMLALSTVAAAQQGPAPGYGSATAYASDYAGEQGSAAVADPAGYAAAKSNVTAIGAEARHAAWLSCWALDDAGVAEPTGSCAKFYEAPEDIQGPTEKPVEQTANETVEDANETVQTTIASLEDLQQGVTPADAGFVWDALRDASGRVMDAIGGIAVRTGAGIDAWAESSAALLQRTLGLARDAMSLSVSGYALLGTGTGDVAVAAWDGLAAGAMSLGDAAIATGDAVGEAAAAVGGAVGDAASATGDALVAGWGAVSDAVAGLFGGATADSDARTAEGDDALLDAPVDTGLLDDVLGTVDAL